MPKLRRDQSLLLWASAAALAVWLIPGVRLMIAPLALLNTHLHELFHALAGLLSGGSVSHIIVRSDFSGVALVQGGWLPLIASAGYVGASLFGGFLVWMGRSQQSARAALIITGGMVALSLIAFVRGDLVGVLSALVWVVVLFVGQSVLKDDAVIFTVQFLGIQQVLTSFLAFLALLNVSMGYGHSDAKVMEQATGIPSMAWATLWMVLSASLLYLCLQASWQGKAKAS